MHMILDMRTLTRTLIFSLWFFKVSKIFLVLIILYCLKPYCYIFDLKLFVWHWKRHIFHCLHLFERNLIFQFFIQTISKYPLYSYYTIMKKSYMCTIMGSSGKDYVLIIYLNFMALRLGFLKVIYSAWISMIPPPRS